MIGVFCPHSYETHCLLIIYTNYYIVYINKTLFIFRKICNLKGDRGSTVVRCCATNRKVAGSIPASVSGFFINIKSLRSHYGSGVDSASNRNEYQEHFLGVKADGV